MQPNQGPGKEKDDEGKGAGRGSDDAEELKQGKAGRDEPGGVQEAQDDDSDYLCQDCNEGEATENVRGRSSPILPTLKEQQAHARTHMPFRSWCRFCVQARLSQNPHAAAV